MSTPERPRPSRVTHFLKILSSVLNLEPSSGTFSTAVPDGVAALDVSFELRAEMGVEPGWAFSADSSAMISRAFFFVIAEETEDNKILQGPGQTSSDVVVRCGGAARVDLGLACGIHRESSDVDGADCLIGPWRGKWGRAGGGMQHRSQEMCKSAAFALF
jgi:hypothetical protein